MDDLEQTIQQIKAHQRARWYYLKTLQAIDRPLESFARLNYTDWTKAESVDDRKRESRKAIAMVVAAKEGKGPPEFIVQVGVTMKAREPVNAERLSHEKRMCELAALLPVYPWKKTVPGFGEKSLATVIALTGNLSNYATVGKMRKRLMLAPYDGFAGSTWKRETWRPRALTSEEWKANPFSGQRFAFITMVADALHKHQIEGRKKNGTKFGKPLGPYGQAYVQRCERTADREWTPMHVHRDALRVMIQVLMRDLWVEWHRATDPQFVNKPWSMPLLEAAE